MKRYFLRLFKYNEWANDKILEVMLQDEFNIPIVIKLFSHIVAAQQLWFDRVLQNNNKVEVWPDYTLEGCLTLSKENSANWIKFVEKMTDDDLNKIVDYVNSRGIAYSNSVLDILTHLINHSSYHRAQIAKKFSENGIAPPLTDFIEFARTTSSNQNA